MSVAYYSLRQCHVVWGTNGGDKTVKITLHNRGMHEKKRLVKLFVIVIAQTHITGIRHSQVLGIVWYILKENFKNLNAARFHPATLKNRPYFDHWTIYLNVEALKLNKYYLNLFNLAMK